MTEVKMTKGELQFLAAAMHVVADAVGLSLTPTTPDIAATVFRRTMLPDDDEEARHALYGAFMRFHTLQEADGD